MSIMSTRAILQLHLIKKLKAAVQDFNKVSNLDGYIIIKYEQLQELILLSASCKECGNHELKLYEQTSSRKGWQSRIGLVCTNSDCDKFTNFELVNT